MIGCLYRRYTPVKTPNNLAGSKCLKFNFRHNMTSAPETAQLQRGGPLSGDARGSRPADRVKEQLRLSGIGSGREASRKAQQWLANVQRSALPIPDRRHKFNGKIDLMRIDLGDDNHDHLIDLNEVIRVAMARQ
jgi:hypothetical protein